MWKQRKPFHGLSNVNAYKAFLFAQDYSNTGSDSTLCSNAKLGSGIPLAGTVPLSSVNQNNTYQGYRYSNDYTDPAYSDCYKVHTGCLAPLSFLN